MLELTNLCRKYDDFSLGPIDLKLAPGTAHGLIGPNGAGKSTLFRTILGTVRKDQGLIKVDGSLVSGESGRWKQHVGYVGDYTPLFEHWSGARNLKAFSAYYPSWSEERAQALASRFGLDLTQVVKKYSTGQRTKLAIILALAHGPELLLLDEPANGLDPVARDVFREALFEQMQNEALTLLYATHHVTEIEHLADQLIFLSSGRVLQHEFVETLKENWGKITFRSHCPLGELPNEIDKVVQGQDCQVISSNSQSTLWFLEKLGIESIETSKLSAEQICVHILKSQMVEHKESDHD